jgi:prophage regulatory protein
MDRGVTMLRLPAVLSRSGVRRATLYKLVREGSFPAPVRIAARAVAWRSDQVDDWIESRPLSSARVTETK